MWWYDPPPLSATECGEGGGVAVGGAVVNKEVYSGNDSEEYGSSPPPFDDGYQCNTSSFTAPCCWRRRWWCGGTIQLLCLQQLALKGRWWGGIGSGGGKPSTRRSIPAMSQIKMGPIHLLSTVGGGIPHHPSPYPVSGGRGDGAVGQPISSASNRVH